MSGGSDSAPILFRAHRLSKLLIQRRACGIHCGGSEKSARATKQDLRKSRLMGVRRPLKSEWASKRALIPALLAGSWHANVIAIGNPYSFLRVT